MEDITVQGLRIKVYLAFQETSNGKQNFPHLFYHRPVVRIH